MSSAVWDGKDYAVIQMLLCEHRVLGVPLAQWDRQGNLAIGGEPVPVGAQVCVSEAGVTW
jgi:hypothetical protein